jgi:hypothetical protein
MLDDGEWRLFDAISMASLQAHITRNAPDAATCRPSSSSMPCLFVVCGCSHWTVTEALYQAVLLLFVPTHLQHFAWIQQACIVCKVQHPPCCVTTASFWQLGGSQGLWMSHICSYVAVCTTAACAAC